MFKLLELAGHSNLGVYARATERHLFTSPTIAKRELREFEEALEVAPVQLHIGGSNIIGSLLAANSQGAILPDFALKSEARVLERAGLRVLRLNDALNAGGNNVLANDHGALCNPDYPDATVHLIEKTLGVPVARGTFAGLNTVGMAGVATQRGVLVHPKATPEEREHARRALHADVYVGTVNHGTGLIGAGLVANSKGAVVGAASTAIEIGRIEDALGFLESNVA